MRCEFPFAGPFAFRLFMVFPTICLTEHFVERKNEFTFDNWNRQTSGLEPIFRGASSSLAFEHCHTTNVCDMKLIPCTKGDTAFVDDEDFVRLSQYSWCGGDYPIARVNGRNVRMHELLLTSSKDPSDRTLVDHRDGNHFNNRRNNLRLASWQQNQANRAKTAARTTTSRFKGVSWKPKNRKWIANISVNYRTRYLGSFLDEEEAARAYDNAARQTFGVFARLNFPQGGEHSCHCVRTIMEVLSGN